MHHETEQSKLNTEEAGGIAVFTHIMYRLILISAMY